MVCTRFRSWSSRTASQSVRPSDYEPGPDGVVDHATGRERQFTVLELPELFIRWSSVTTIGVCRTIHPRAHFTCPRRFSVDRKEPYVQNYWRIYPVSLS